MRLNNFLLLLTLLIVPLSGCLGFGDEEGDDDHGDDCDHLTGADHDACHAGDDDHGDGMDDDHGDGMDDDHGDDNETQVPNVLPEAALTMTVLEDGRAYGSNDAILPTQSITFSARGSSDADGEIDLIGLTVKDSNETRTVQLYENGDFVDVTMKFDHVGPVNVTLRILDDRGEGVQLETNAYVNQQESQSKTVNLYLPSQSGCSAAFSGDPVPILVDQQFYFRDSFTVAAGAKWFSAEATGGIANIAICDGDTVLAEGEASAETAEGEWSSSATQYAIVVFPDAPQATVEYTVTVHYEPKATA